MPYKSSLSVLRSVKQVEILLEVDKQPLSYQALKAMPKIDLHRHLEGSLRLDTLAEIALEHGLDLPGHDIEELRPYVQVTNDPPSSQSFLAKFEVLRRFYRSREAVARLAYEAVADAAADNVHYLELRFSPQALSRDFVLISCCWDWVCWLVLITLWIVSIWFGFLVFWP